MQPTGEIVDAATPARPAEGFNKPFLRYNPPGWIRDLGGIVFVAVAVTGCSCDCAAPQAPSVVVSTFAGAAGQPGTMDGPGDEARFNQPTGVWIDRAGDLYVADSYNHTIRKITSAGVVSTLAGTPGVYGFADGPVVHARFAFPHGVASDGAGNIYVADVHNRVIRKIDPAGVVSTFAGAVGDIGFMDGPGLQARFNQPEGVATDIAGNVYVADAGNNAIRKISPDGLVSTLAASLFSPMGVAIDGAGYSYVASGQTVVRIAPTGEISLLAGSLGSSGSVDGLGAAARFDLPFGIAIDMAGNVYVTDAFNHTIRKISPLGLVTTLAGAAGSVGENDGTAEEARFSLPWGIATDGAGNIYVADSYNHTIRKITLTGTPR